jgi:DNA modification methylase
MPELIWAGKYDGAGKRTAPLRVALPFQTVETVNESAQERQRSLFSGDEQSPDWRNRLIWGDKKYVLPALIDEFAGQVDLIYIDPPFATGQDFSLPVQVEGHEFEKEPSMLEVKAYRDTWSSGLDSYLEWFYSMASDFYQLLSPTGSLYVHLDQGVAHYVKLLLDDIFGIDQFRNDITWKRKAGRGETNSAAIRFGVTADSILFYARSPATPFRRQYRPSNAQYIESKFTHVDEQGRRYRLDNITSPSYRQNLVYEYKGYSPPPKGWAVSLERMKEMDADGRLYLPEDKHQRIQRKRFLDELEGETVDSLWDDIPPANSQAKERVGYPTQKPEALLRRIIETSTNDGDLVLDCVCGSGTTANVAELLKRRWIVSDLGRFAVHTTRKRLLGVSGVRPFVVQNLGKYERQLWQTAEFGDSATARTAAYRAFILDLYHATPVSGYSWLHGLKQGRMVHVGTVDAPVTTGDVKQIVAEFRKAVGTGKDAPTTKGIDILGWDFAFELNEVARQDAEKAGIDLRLVRIPREVLEKRAVEQGDIRFFELAALSVGVKQSRQTVTLSLDDFIIPLDDVPTDVQKAVTHWSQWIDYWAVDWNNNHDTFHNEWQAYRTRQSTNITLLTEHRYGELGDYTVVVKVIDILGNDTTTTLSVKVVARGA